MQDKVQQMHCVYLQRAANISDDGTSIKTKCKIKGRQMRYSIPNQVSYAPIMTSEKLGSG